MAVRLIRSRVQDGIRYGWQKTSLTIYLDNNASAPLTPAVRVAVESALNMLGANPSSAHSAGTAIRTVIERTRDLLSESFGGFSTSYFFTSGCTEANNAVLWSVASAHGADARLITSVVEHPSVTKTCEAIECQGASVKRIPVNSAGLLDLDVLTESLRTRIHLVSVQWVNSETGVIQPIEEISQICRRSGTPLHVDAAQAVGRVPIDLDRIEIDFLTSSGHKLHALPGVGVLFASQPRSLRPLLFGGGQEEGQRSGTENWVGVASLEAAVAERTRRFETHVGHMRQLRTEFERRLRERLDWVSVNGEGAPRVCNTSNIRFGGLDGQAIVARLDQLAVICSQTSACSSQRPEPSNVLRAMGLTERQAYSSIRFSFSVLNTAEDVRLAVDRIVEAVGLLRRAATSIKPLVA